MSKVISVMVVDDHPVVRLGLAAIVRSDPAMQLVAEAENGRKAAELFDLHRPDVTLMDLRMPVMSGVEAIREICITHPKAAIVVLTTYHGDQDIQRALAAGARAYLLKGMDSNDLLAAIRRVHRGGRYLPTAIADALKNHRARAELTPRQSQILELIVRGMSNREIGEQIGLAEATVKWHVNIMLDLMDVRDRTQAAVAALSRGFVEL